MLCWFFFAHRKSQTYVVFECPVYDRRGRKTVLYEITLRCFDQHNATENGLFDAKIMFLLGNRYIAAVFVDFVVVIFVIPRLAHIKCIWTNEVFPFVVSSPY